MPRRIVPRKTVKQVKRLLATKKLIKDIAKSEGVSVHYVRFLNMRFGIRPVLEKKKRISERKRRFVKKALGLAKYTSMKKIAKRASVSEPTVKFIDMQEGIRDALAVFLGRTRLPEKKVRTAVELLRKHPEMSFTHISKLTEMSVTTVERINRTLNIQSKEHIQQRLKEMKKKSKKKRLHLFSTEEKWKIIEKSTPYIAAVISKYAVPENIQIPIEDLIQETKLRGFTGLDLATTREHPERYLGGIANRVTIQHMKKEAKRLNLEWNAFEAMITKKKTRKK